LSIQYLYNEKKVI